MKFPGHHGEFAMDAHLKAGLLALRLFFLYRILPCRLALYLDLAIV